MNNQATTSTACGFDLDNPSCVTSILDILDGDCSELEGFNSDDDVELDIPPKTCTRIGADVPPNDDELFSGDEELQNEFRAAAPLLDALESSETVTTTPINAEQIGQATVDNSTPSSSANSRFMTTNRKNIQWRKRPFNPPVIGAFEDNHEDVFTSDNPIDFFRKYIPNECISQIVQYTNMYGLQSGKAFQPTHDREINIFIGLHIYMSVLKFPRIEMYWRNSLKVMIFLENIDFEIDFIN
ncbi:uncharacterized protein LOC120354224 [Nilaparvata lugens]|uniref:uncharacterized protein LOC120354224 n=1 Tax=Nilaparvata lugens TaxID=108931 RepID=UPI00193DA979|nr:uncharacterized protein LOC120354224 [Nilaparvata lugens]